MVKVTYKTGDKVFAKVKGYPPWPARIEGDTGKKKYNVLFYGTQETGAIRPEDICYYSKNKNNYVHKYLKRVGYEDAVKQIEEAIKKDGGDGNDNSSLDESVNDIDMSDTSSVSSAQSEKKAPKRRVTSISDEPTPKKQATRTSRRTASATSDSKEDISEDPVSKKTNKKRTTSSDNGIKDDAKKDNEEQEKSDNETLKEINDNQLAKTEESSESKNTEEPKEVVESETDKSENNEPLVVKKDSPKKSTKVAADDKKPNEIELVESENNANLSLKMEEEKATDESEANDEQEKAPVIVDVVTEEMLNNDISYAEHVKKDIELYKKKPVEQRKDGKDQVLPIQLLPSGKYCGVKLHKDWPLKHENEYERALYDEEVAKAALEIKKLLSSKSKTVDEIDAEIIVPDIQMTADDIQRVTYERDIELKKKRMERLKKEADLVSWDSKIKNNLGLDKALPDAALECLKEFGKLEKGLDSLMFKKHPHVLDTVRRLRKYIGNTKEWDMSTEDMDVFIKKAEQIRSEAEKIYNKIKNIVPIKEEKGTFWDAFMDLVSDFRTKCKDRSESEVLVLCAEPDSRQAFMDKLDEVTESEGTTLNASNKSEAVIKETSVQGWTEKK